MNMVSTLPEPLPPGFFLASRYRIECQLGRGGFGVIYKALDLAQHGRPVAIKQINLHGLSVQDMIEATDTYNREVTILSRLKHESLPCIHDTFTDSDHWDVVMDYINGETLEETLKKVHSGRLHLKQVIDIGLALCDVLSYLHSQHPPIIFRDVKPANIMMTRTGNLYLIDFGIARQYRPGQGKDTGALGSPGYAAPEQYGKTQTTPQTDIYGLGATLQTLLTGQEPMDIALNGISAQHPLPKDVQSLIDRMLERDPAQRPQNMEQVKQHLLEAKNNLVREKVRQRVSSTRLFLKEALGGYTIALLLGALTIFLLFGIVSGLDASPFWLPYLLSDLLAICSWLAVGLYRGIKEASPLHRAREMTLILWKHLQHALLFVAILTVVFYALEDMIQQSPVWTADMIILVVAGCTGIFFVFSKLSELIRELLYARKKRVQSKQQQAVPLQQQIQNIHTYDH